MTKKYTLNILIVMTFLFTLPILTVAQSESSWTYSEGWWEVYSVSESDTFQQDSKVLFPQNQNDGRLRLYNRATTELNTKANRHGVTLTVKILDAQTRTVLAENSQFGFYTNENTHLTVTTNHVVKPGEEEIPPMETNLVQITHCPGDPGGGGEPTGYFGASTLNYYFDHIAPDGKVWFEHQGNHCLGDCNNCPTTCGNASFIKQYMPVICAGSQCVIGSRAMITVPWGPLGCALIGLGINHVTIPQCIDIGYN